MFIVYIKFIKYFQAEKCIVIAYFSQPINATFVYYNVSKLDCDLIW